MIIFYFQQSLSEIYDDYTVAEWIEQKIYPLYKDLNDFKVRAESLKRRNTWPRRPFPILKAKLYIPSTLNIDLILWHTQLIVCAENVKSWFKSWIFPFICQAYILPHTLNCMCVSLFKF